MEESAQLAESTAILLNVSEFQDATEASEALISTMQAFSYLPKESQHVVDILNEVGNNFAVSSDGLAVALQDSASALMEGGNTLEQSVALIAAANRVVQDPNSVGSALRTISLRLRGTSVEILEEMGEETDGVVESTSKLQEKLKALTGVDILTDTGAYKDTYTILKEIGSVWDNLTDIDKAATLELMAGKNRANTLSAILSNMKDLEGAYKSALNAEGSALRENEAYLDSIQGRIDLFTNALQTMWMNFINDDALKFIIDAGTALIKFVDTVGLIPTAVGGFSAFKLVAKSIGEEFASMGEDIREAMNISGKDTKESKVFDDLADDIEAATKAKEKHVQVTKASTDAETSEEVAIKRNTAAEKENTTAIQKGIGVEQRDTQQDLASGAAEKAEAEQIRQNTNETLKNNAANSVGSKIASAASSVGGKLLNVVGTALKGFAFGALMSIVTIGVEKLFGFIDDKIHETERAVERANEALNTYKDETQSIEDTKATTDDLAASYTRLSSGVNTLTNENIGLTVESYEEYLDIVNQIAKLHPELIAGYDAEGNAILTLKGKVDQLTDSYRKAQEKAALALLTSDNKKDVWTKYTDGMDLGVTYYYEDEDWPNAEIRGPKITKDYQQNLVETILAMDNETFAQLYEYHKNPSSKRWNLLLGQLGQEYSSKNVGKLSAAFNQGFDIGKDELKSIDTYRAYFVSELSKLNQDIANSMSGIREMVSASLVFDPIYQQLDAGAQGMVDVLVKNIDPNMIAKSGQNSSQEFIDWFSREIITQVESNKDLFANINSVSDTLAKAMFNKDNDTFNDARNEFYNLVSNWLNESGNIEVDPKADVVTQYLQRLAQDIENESKNYQVRVNMQTDFESADDLDKILADYTGDAEKEIQRAFDEFNLGEYVTVKDLYAKIQTMMAGDDGVLRADELNDAYDAFLSGDMSAWSVDQRKAIVALDAVVKMYGTDIDTVIAKLIELGIVSESLDDIASFNLASDKTNESVDKFQETTDKIKSAWESLNSGEMTKSEFIDLAQEFPKLMEGIDFSDDNWMTKAKENLESLNDTTITDFITELETAKQAMAERGEDTTIVQSFIDYAEQLREQLKQTDAAIKTHADTVSGLTESYENYKNILTSTDEVLYDGQKVSESYYETLKEFIGDADKLNACFDENNKQIITNADGLRKLIAEQKEVIAQNVQLAKAQSQLKYYELVEQLDMAVEGYYGLDDAGKAATDALIEQISTIKSSINQYQLLEDSLLGTTSAFEKFAQAQETDSKNTYGDQYVEMVQTMYDAMTDTGKLGTPQFWAAADALVPEEVYGDLDSAYEKIQAIYKYFNSNILPTLTLDEDQFSIGYEAIEDFVEKAQEVGVFSGTDVTSFGLSAKFFYDLEEGEDALQAFANKMGMTTTQVYAMLSEMDKYNADGVGLSMLLQLDNSTAGQLTYAANELERLYIQRKKLFEQQDAGEDVTASLNQNWADIAEAEARMAGIEKQISDTARAYIEVGSVISNISSNKDLSVEDLKAQIPEGLYAKLKLKLDGVESVDEVLQILTDYKLELEEPTTMELVFEKDQIDDEIRAIEAQEPTITTKVKLNDDGLYEAAEGVSVSADLQHYLDLKNEQVFVSDALSSALSLSEHYLSQIADNTADMAGKDGADAAPADDKSNEGGKAEHGGTGGRLDGSKPEPNTELVQSTLDTSKELSMLVDAITQRHIDLSKLDGPLSMEEEIIWDSLISISERATELNNKLIDGEIYAEDAKTQLSILKTEAAKLGVKVSENFNEAAEKLAPTANVDLNNRPLVDFNLENFGTWAEYYKEIIKNADQYAADYVERTKEELSALERGDSAATVYSQTYYKSDFDSFKDGDSDAAIVVTPILPDGTVLSPGELASYAEQLLNGEEIEPNITLGFFDGENFAADASEFANNLHEAQAELYGLNDAMSETEKIYQAYASNEEMLETLKKIEDKTYALTKDEALAFGFQINEGEILTVQNVIDKLLAEQDRLRQSSLFDPEWFKVEGVATYSELQSEVASFNELLDQTDEIIGDNIEITQAYKDSLISLCENQDELDELNECFDTNNKLVVKDSKALKKLVREKKKELAADVKLSKAQSQLEYYDLVKQLSSALTGVEELDSATMGHVNSILSQIDVVQQSIYKFQLLEDQLLGTTNAFEKYKKAQEIDGLNTYGDDYVSMAQTMYDALYKTGEVGSEANWAAIQALIPPEVYQHLKNEGDQLKAIYDYFNKNIVPTLTLKDDQFSLDYDATENFVEKGMKNGVFVEDATKNGKTNLDLVEGMNLEKAAELMGMTEAQAYAMFAALDKFNFNGSEPSFLEQLDDSLSGDIMEITANIEELNREKLALLEGGITGDEQKRIDEINASLAQNKQELQDLGTTAYDTWQQYVQVDSAIAKLGEIEDASIKVSEALPEEVITSLGLTGNETVQQAYDILLAKQLELEEPTVLTAQLAIDSINTQITELERLLENPRELKIEAKQSGKTVEELTSEIEQQIQGLEEDKVSIATTFGIELSEEDQKTLDSELNAIEKFIINDKEFAVVGNGTSETMEWLKKINGYTIADKSYTTTHEVITKNKVITTNTIKSVYAPTPTSHGGRYTMADGTAHVLGTAYQGGSWGASKTETALVGELGPEMVVRDGRWFTVGDNGAEFANIQRGDIIFNHKQTEDLLSKGYVSGRGKAYAEGTAYALWQPTSPNTSQSNKAGRDFSAKGNELYNSSNKLSQAAKDISTASDKLSDDFKEIFDWIEVRIEEITEDLDLKSAKLENTVGSKKQNVIIDDMIELNKKLYNNLTAGASKYYEYAKKLLNKVPSEYREAAKDGSIAIESFTGKVGESTLEAIQDYREWVQKGADATQQAEETLTEISNLAKQAIDNIAADYENKKSLRDIKIEQYEAYNALLETDVGYESAKIYQAMIKETNKNIKTLEEQRNKMQAELNKRVESGEIKKYSQDWYDAVNDLAAVDTEIIELTTDTENWQDAINELHWDKLDDLMSRLEAVSDEANNLIDILSNKDAVDEAGNWTNEGIASLGLYAQQMEVAEMQAQKYKDEINYLNKNWKKLGYTEQEYLEKLEELKSSQYDAIKAYHDTKDALVDLNKERVEAIKEGIQKEIDAYEELINKKKEALNAEKDLHDFQKGVMEQEKDIAAIQRQLAALAGDNSASARAKRAQLEAELLEAQAQLEETYYDRSMSDQQHALDKELEHFQDTKNKEMEGWDEYLEDTERVVSDSLSTIQANTDTVYKTLKQMGSEYSLSITEALTSPWKKGENAIQSYSEKFGLTMSATVDELKALESEFNETMAKIEQEGAKATDTVNDNVNRYQEATYVEPPKQESSSSGSGGGNNGSNSSGSSGSTNKTSGGNTASSSGTSSTSSSISLIKYGQSGTRVRELQQALNELGFNCGNADGIFGDKTYDAVTRFQRSGKFGGAISADGIVGVNTIAKFDKAGYIVSAAHVRKKSASGNGNFQSVAKYASGTSGVSNNQWALIDELGEELVLHAQNGKLAYLTKGSAVVPHDISENLMKLGQLDPSAILDQNKPTIGTHPEIHNTEIHIDNSIAELIHIDNCSTDTLPDIKKIVNDALEKHTQKLNNSLRRYTR